MIRVLQKLLWNFLIQHFGSLDLLLLIFALDSILKFKINFFYTIQNLIFDEKRLFPTYSPAKRLSLA